MRMPATGTVLLLIAIWILVNLFSGDLPKLILDKSQINVTPEPVPVPAPNPTPNPTPDPQFHPNPFPRPDWEPGQLSGQCPAGTINIAGLCVPITNQPTPNPKPPIPTPFPIPIPGLPGFTL